MVWTVPMVLMKSKYDTIQYYVIYFNIGICKEIIQCRVVLFQKDIFLFTWNGKDNFRLRFGIKTLTSNSSQWLRSCSWISLTAHGSTHHGRVILDSLNRFVQITRPVIATFSVSIAPIIATFCFVAIFAASFVTGFLRFENSFIYEMFQTRILNFVT